MVAFSLKSWSALESETDFSAYQSGFDKMVLTIVYWIPKSYIEEPSTRFSKKRVHVAVVFQHCLKECLYIFVGCVAFVICAVQLLKHSNEVVQLLLAFSEILSIQKWQLRGGQVLQIFFERLRKFACGNIRPQQPLTVHWCHSFHNDFLFHQTLMCKAVGLEEIDYKVLQE